MEGDRLFYIDFTQGGGFVSHIFHTRDGFFSMPSFGTEVDMFGTQGYLVAGTSLISGLGRGKSQVCGPSSTFKKET